MLSEIELRKHIDKIVLWIQDYVNKVGAKGVVIGNSGGKDSATVIALASLALGKEKVLTVGMPCQSKEKDAHSNVKNKRICKEGPVFRAEEVEF